MATPGAQWRVLAAGFDELNLWELPGRNFYIRSGGTSVTPDLPVDEVRQALAEALRGGLVQLYDQDDTVYRRFNLDEALAIVADEGEWSAASAQHRAALAITPAGEAASHSVFERYRRGSPFLASGISDPQVFLSDEDESSG
jgi:hypothetical protein